jgi:hypothetical protein
MALRPNPEGHMKNYPESWVRVSIKVFGPPSPRKHSVLGLLREWAGVADPIEEYDLGDPPFQIRRLDLPFSGAKLGIERYPNLFFVFPFCELPATLRPVEYRLVLKGVDGLLFVPDPAEEAAVENGSCWRSLLKALDESPYSSKDLSLGILLDAPTITTRSSMFWCQEESLPSRFPLDLLQGCESPQEASITAILDWLKRLPVLA